MAKITSNGLVKIGVAARLLGVSIQTLRRWDASGKLVPTVTPGGTRLYSQEQLGTINPALALAKKDITDITDRTDISDKKDVLGIGEGRPIISGFQKLGNIFTKAEQLSPLPQTPQTGQTNKRRLWAYAPAVVAAGILFFCLGLNIYINSYLNKAEKDRLLAALGENFAGVLAESTAKQSVEINADTTINGDLVVNGLTGSSVKTGSLLFTTLTKQITLGDGKIISLPDATTTLTGIDTTQTLTNKSISGSSNTLTNIPNSALSNSKVTISPGTNLSGGGDVSLGSSVTLGLNNNPAIASLSATTIYVNGDATVSGSLLPAENGGSQNLGSTNYYWNAIYVNNIYGPPVGTFWFWQRAAGAIAPATISDDLLIGGAATASAKFQVSGTTGYVTTSQITTSTITTTAGDLVLNPVGQVSINSATISGSLVLNGTNSLQTTKNQSLTLGGNTTGNVVVAPNNTTVATFTPASLNMNNLPIINIGNAGTDFGTNGSLTLANSLTVSSGGIGVTSGGITITAGGLGVTAGNITLSSGQSISSAGTMSLSTNDWGISTTGALTGISGIANDAGYTQTGASTNTFSGATTIANTASVSGALTLYGTPTIGTTAKQSLTLGDANTGNVVFTSSVGSNILPSGDGTLDLGSSSYQWNNIYAKNIITPGAGVSGYWQRAEGAVAPVNITDDLLVGGAATAAATFRVDRATGNITAGTFNGLTVSSGSVTSGTWTGTVIGTQYGGTGKDWSAVLQGNVPYFNGTGAMTTLGTGTANQVLITGGSSANPSWSNMSTLLSAGTDITLGGTTIVTINDASTLQSVTGRGASTSNAVTLSAAGTALTVNNNLIVGGTTTFNSLAYTWPGTQTANGVLTTDGSGILSWVSPGGTGAIGYWQRTGGSLAPFNITDSLNLGATATTSALTHFAGTANEVSFFNSGGGLAIGQTSAAEALDVNGRVHLSQVSAPGTTTDRLYNLTGALAWNGAAVCTAAGNCTGTASALGGSGAAGYLAKWSGTYNLTTSLLYDTGTEVQVSGNATASGTLGVGGNTQIDANLNVKGDVTLNRVTAGTWQAGVIGTKYGGTGKDWSAVAQGGVPYFDGTGSMTTLGVGTKSQVLVTNGANDNPAWANMASLISQTGNISITGTQTLTINTVMNPTFSTSVTTPLIHSASGLVTIDTAASVSGALTLYGTPTIGTTAKQSLTLGDANTGNVEFFGSSNYISPLGNLSILGILNGQTISPAANFTGTVTAAGAINSTVTGIQTGSVTRIDTTGNLTNIANITTTGTASMAGALTLTTTPTIQSTSNQSLTLGGDSTGNIILKPNNVTLATFTPTALDMNNLPIINIGNAGTDFGTNGSLTLANSLTVSSGGIGVTSGGITVTAGGIGVTAGNIALTGTQTISATGDLTVASGTSNTLILNPSGGNVQFNGLTASLAVYTDANKNLTSAIPTTGALGYWTRTGTMLAPATAGDSATISGTLGVGGEASLSAKLILGSVTPQINVTNNLPLQLGFQNTGAIQFGSATYYIGAAGAANLGNITAGTYNGASIDGSGSGATYTGGSASGGTLTLISTSHGTKGNIQFFGTGNYITSAGAFVASSTITGTTINGTTGINTGATAGTQRIDASGNLVNIGNITATGTLTNTGTATISGTLGAGGNTTLQGDLAVKGNTSFTGVIDSGTWQATAIGPTFGGTGQTTVTTGDLLYGSATNTWSKLADVAVGNVLISGGVGAIPSWGKVTLGTHTSGNYVSQVIGTANQITASAATGDVTLSVPSDFRAPGTVNAVSGLYTGATAGTQRIDASGNLVNIGNITATGTLTNTGTATISGTLGAGGNTTINADLLVKGNTNLVTGSSYQINGANVLSATTLGTGVTTSSLTTVGALTSGSIASGFGTIATANTITGTTINGTTGINTGATAGTQRIDASGNLVNIGNITATGTLTNTGTATISGTLGVGGNASMSAFLTLDAAVAKIGSTNMRDLVLGGTETGGVYLSPKNTTGLYVGGAGNVGIGTTGPALRLDVFGTTGYPVDTSITIGAARISTNQGIILDIGSANASPWGAWLQAHDATTPNYTKFPILLNPLGGNVGIGTTGPGTTLEVVSTNASDASVYLSGYGASATTYPGLGGKSARGTLASPTATQVNDYLMYVGGRGYGTTTWATGSRGLIAIKAAEAFTDSAQGAYIIFETTPIGSATRAERMRILDNGNVGIGTTAPTSKLHVEGQCVAAGTLIRRKKKRRKNGTDDEDGTIDGRAIEDSGGKSKIEDGFNPQFSNLKKLSSMFNPLSSSDWEDVPVEDINVDDEVLTLDEKSGEFVWSKVEKTMDKGTQKVFELVTETGKSIETTDQHPYLVNLAEEKPLNTNFFYYQAFEEVQAAAHQMYREVFEGKSVCVPALKNETVTFGHEGWNHLMQEKRSRFDLLTRFFALPKIFIVLELAKKAKKEAGKINKDLTFWALEGIVDGVWVKVVIRSVKGGPKYFYSVVWKGEDYRPEVRAAIKKGAVSRLYPRRQASGEALAFSTDFFKELSLSPMLSHLGRPRRMVTSQLFNKLTIPENKGKVNPFGKLRVDGEYGRTIKWMKVKDIKIGSKVATTDGWERVLSIKELGRVHTFDLQIANTHNFVANGIVAHNTTGKALVDLNYTGTDQNIFVASQAGILKFALSGLGTSPVASISATSSFAGLVVDNTIGDLFTASSSGLNRFVITQAGNVGIGTTGPGANGVGGTPTILQVHNSGTSVALLSLSNTGTALGAVPGVINFVSTGLSGTKRLAEIAAIKGDALTVNALGSLTFSTANGGAVAEWMRITNAGNVGIGTTGPSEKLHVAGGIKFTSDLTSGGIGTGGYVDYYNSNTRLLAFGPDASTRSGFQLYQSSSNNTLPNIPIEVQADGDVVLVQSTGNVGIGTTGPSQLLTVSGSAGDTALFTNSQSWGTRISLQATETSGRNWSLISTADGAGEGPGKFMIQDQTASGVPVRLVIDTSGNVGIGTTGPLAKLDIAGSASMSANLSLRTAGTSHNFNILDDGLIVFQGSPGGDAGLAAVMTIKGTGGVQVGAPTGGDKGVGSINVAGDIYKNNAAYGNPDYVLEKYYTGQIVKYADKEGASTYQGLMSLPNLENYLKTNYALPGFGQDADHGIFSGSDMLLVRTEELTLYAIDNYKSIASVSASLINLQTDISGLLLDIPQIKSDLDLLKQEMASTSARLAKVETTTTDNTASISGLLNGPASLNLFSNIDISTVSASFASFSESLKVVGTTQLSDTTIGGSLQVGLLHFDDLKASISSLTGLVTIDSNLQIMGDATVSGKLRVEKGVELKDTATGEIYCLQIVNGETVKKKGECQ